MTASHSILPTLSTLLRTRRSVRDFLPTPIAPAVLNAVLEDAKHAPSWSNTQPYRLAIASGELRDQLSRELCACFDAGTRAQHGGLFDKLRALVTRKGLPDGDFSTRFPYPPDLLVRRRATGFGLYESLGIGREDYRSRDEQMRKNFEFFGAPTVIFLFVHSGLREFAVLDTGIFLQSLLLAAQSHGLGTCAQGALATWAGPVRRAFVVPEEYRLICGVSIGYASQHRVNSFNPGRGSVSELVLPKRP